MRRIAPGIRENSGWKRGRLDKSPRLCMEESTTVKWWPGKEEMGRISTLFSLSSWPLSHSHCLNPWKSQRTREPSLFSTWGSGSRRKNRGHPRLLSHSVFFRPYLNADLLSCIHPSPPTQTASTDYTFIVLCHMPLPRVQQVSVRSTVHIVWIASSEIMQCTPHSMALPLHCILSCVD